jgi:Ser/Thr protein kinase RdoA (MazF antagonist)
LPSTVYTINYIMYESILGEVLRAYGIQPVNIRSSQKGYRNEIWPVELADGSICNVTFFKREDGIVDRARRADHVSEYLADAGFPARRRIDKRLLQIKTPTAVVYAGAYTYLPGVTIPWEAYTMDHLKLLGKAMSDMHSLLAVMPPFGLPSVYDEYTAIVQRMQRYFSEARVTEAIYHKLSVAIEPSVFTTCLATLNDCQENPGQQALHMDFVRGNILFDGTTTPAYTLNKTALSGVLDFEKTASGLPVVDIARTLAFLLVDCKYKSAEKVYKYFLHSGYIKRGAGSIAVDETLLGDLVILFLLHDFYKFLRHNPYESLYANEHYIRTRDILHKRNMIRYV